VFLTLLSISDGSNYYLVVAAPAVATAAVASNRNLVAVAADACLGR
jgi:hypothetical protein